MPKVKSVNFGISPDDQYDDGTQGSIAINKFNMCVEVHRGESDTEKNLYFRIAHVSGVSLNFQDAKPTSYGTGNNPTVALNADGVVIEAHDRDGKLYYSVRAASIPGLSAKTETELPNQDPSSSDPTLALNKDGVVVEVHRSNSDLFWRLGELKQGRLTWQDDSHLLIQNGQHPSVSINDDGRIVVVYEDDSELYYLTGQLVAATPKTGTEDAKPASITWNTDTRRRYDEGIDPSVAITSDNWVYEVHKGEIENKLYQRTGRLSDDGTIDWKTWLGGGNPSYLFDIGVRPRVATNDKVAVHVHQSETRKSLFGTASLIFDRANWTGDNFGDLKNKTLSEMVFPASHDAGQYRELVALQTQTLDIFGQLSVGVRWFDLRLGVEGGKIKIHHDIFFGVDFQDVLDDVRAFMTDHNELVILKLSHFRNFKDNIDEKNNNPDGTRPIDKAIAMIRDKDKGLRPWLVTRELARRLGKTTLRELITPNAGAVLIVVDNKDDNDNIQAYLDFNKSANQNRGIRTYRDWYAPDPQKGDLTVFDIYSHTNTFSTMATGTDEDPDSTHARERVTDGSDPTEATPLPVGQFPKFALFDGVCRFNNPAGEAEPCDLFLLSWTLAVDGESPVSLSRAANKRLVEFSASHAGPSHERIINLLYTDVSQDSRSADVALIRNKLVS
jgi:hypothetical protein